MRDDPLGLDPLGLDDPLDLETKKTPSVGRQLVDATKGTLQALGDMGSSVAKFPVQVGAAALGKIVRPSMNLKELYDAAGQELNAKFPTLGDESNLAYKKIMTPFNKYDEYVVQPVARGAGSLAGRDAQGAAEILMNMAPVPGIPHAMRGAKRVIEAVDPALRDRPSLPKTELPVKAVEDPLGLDKPAEPIPTENQMELPDAAMAVAPQFGIHEGMGRVDENGMPIRADLSMDVQNVQNPLQRNLWGDELDMPTGDGGIPLTQAIDSIPPGIPARTPNGSFAGGTTRDMAINNLTGQLEPTPDLFSAMDEANPQSLPLETPQGTINLGMRRTQSGGIDFEGISSSLASLGRKLLPSKPPVGPDTVATPRSVETIANKKALADKARAVGYEGSVYERVSTLEEVFADPGKDISNNPVRDYVKPGVEGMIRTNSDNKVLKFARTKFQDARNTAEKFSRTYVTGSDGINRAYRQMTEQEFIPVAEALQLASRERTPLTPEMMKEMGWNEKQMAFASKAREAFDAMYTMGNDVLMQQGFEPFKYHEGYVPSMFSGAYTTILTDAKGRKAIAQADTKWGMKEAVKYYQELGYTSPVELPRRGLKDTTMKSNRVYDGFNDIVNTIAKNDPEFANLKAEVDQRLAESTKRLYSFDVHEKNKTGARGSLGDRPWLSRGDNAKQFLEGMVNYLEEGSRYYSQQGALTELGKLQNNPELTSQMPNTFKYLDRYTRHITGKNLSPVGAAANWILDAPWSAIGVGPKIPAAVANKIKTYSTIHMMGVFNLAFLGAQLTQPLTGGLPEAMKIGSTMGIPAADVAASLSSLGPNISKVVMQVELGKDMKAPQHLVDAYTFAKDAGMFTFSESELAHEVMKNRYVSALENGLSWPIEFGERATRPPVFMWYVDLFHKAGLDGEKLYQTAQTATDYAMANYHPDERPMLYSSFGTMGQFMGALTTYKHNLLDQFTSRTVDAGKGQITPLATMLGVGYMLYGISGLPGYQEADEITQAATGKTIRNIAFDSMPHDSLWDGMLSASTGIDFQSRMSMASALPDDLGSTLSPQISNFWDVFSKAYVAARDGDKNSEIAAMLAATPAGLRGATEEAVNTDKEGFVLNKYGQRKYDTPRTETEQTTRAVTGLRPLRERLEDESVYAVRKAETKRMDKLKDASSKIESALIRDDRETLKKYAQVYIDNGGDISQVLSQRQIQTFLVDAKKSEKQRKEGVPSNNINSITRYKAYND